MVFSSQYCRRSSGRSPSASPCSGTWRISTSKYRANFSQHTCTGPQTKFGLSYGLARGDPPVAPLPLHRQAAQHAGLAGSGGGAADGLRRIRCVPEIGDHVHTAASRFPRSADTRPCRSYSCRSTRPSACALPARPTSCRTSRGSAASCRPAAVRHAPRCRCPARTKRAFRKPIFRHALIRGFGRVDVVDAWCLRTALSCATAWQTPVDAGHRRIDACPNFVCCVPQDWSRPGLSDRLAQSREELHAASRKNEQDNVEDCSHGSPWRHTWSDAALDYWCASSS